MNTTTHTVAGSPIGDLTLVAGGGALVGLYLEQHKRRPPHRTFGDGVDSGFEDAISQLEAYFAGTRTVFDLEPCPTGDDFERQVWTKLQDIPYGESPCHRVIGADGRLVGYAGGLERKRFLLELEEPAAKTSERLF